LVGIRIFEVVHSKGGVELCEHAKKPPQLNPTVTAGDDVTASCKSNIECKTPMGTKYLVN
jgi:hypothetical protein